MKNKELTDFLIVGGGVIGLALARRLSALYPNTKINILEKEKQGLGVHTSGRNSGVLHAGFYYNSDSLKAKYSVLGNQQWRKYCDQYNVPIKRTGKFVVMSDGQGIKAQNEQAEHLKFLYEQGIRNGVELQMMKIEEARKMDSNITGQDGSDTLFSPNTAVVDIHACLKSIHDEVEKVNPNFKIHFGEEFQRQVEGKKEIVTKEGKTFEYKHMINSSGQQALEIAQQYGEGKELDIFPMKGLYCMSKKPLDHKYNTIVYPIPLKGAYTLGVHSTMTPNGFMKIGPTTSPAFALEGYQGLEKLNFSDLKKIINSYRLIMMSSQRGLIWEYITRDLPKHSIKVLIKDISRIHKMDINEFESHFYARPGIRAQLIDVNKRFLINDFLLKPQNIIQQEKKEFDLIHCLNISSPGWTSAFPFANKILSELLQLDEDELLNSDQI